MSTKLHPSTNDCFDKALPDEPVFVLLGRDLAAPGTVRQWAYQRERAIVAGEKPEEDRAKVAEARALARTMEQWRANRDGAWR